MTRLTPAAEQQRERNRQSKLRYQRALAEERKLEQSRDAVDVQAVAGACEALEAWLRGEGLTDFEVCCRMIGRVEVE